MTAPTRSEERAGLRERCHAFIAREICEHFDAPSPRQCPWCLTSFVAREIDAAVEEERAAWRESCEFHRYECPECKDTTILRVLMEALARSGDKHAMKWVEQHCGTDRRVALERSIRAAGEGALERIAKAGHIFGDECPECIAREALGARDDKEGGKA